MGKFQKIIALHNRTVVRLMGLAGVMGGLYWFILHTFFNPDWGPPGTSRYLTYETFNRVWPPGLFLMLLGFVGFYRVTPVADSRPARIGLRSIVVGFVMMIVGNIAEFWMFSQASYQDASRNLSYMTFFIGMLLLLAGTFLWGIVILRSGKAPRWCGLLLLFLTPVTFAAFFTGSPAHMPPIAVVISLGIFTLIRSSVQNPTLKVGIGGN